MVDEETVNNIVDKEIANVSLNFEDGLYYFILKKKKKIYLLIYLFIYSII